MTLRRSIQVSLICLSIAAGPGVAAAQTGTGTEETRQGAANTSAEEELRQLSDEAEALRRTIEETRRRAEEERRRLMEDTEALRKAEEAQREAEAKLKEREAEALARANAAAEQPKPEGGEACQPGQSFEVKNSAEPGGLIKIEILSECRAGQAFTIAYGPYTFIRTLNGDGRGSFTLDLFLGLEKPLELRLEDGTREPIAKPKMDFSGLSKVALVWKAPVNLDLHALEYLAAPASEGHIRPDAPSSYEAALKAATPAKGRGFLSSSMGEDHAGDKVDVYTFVHVPEQRRGIVSLFVDFETRANKKSPDTCGDGENASVKFDILRLVRGKQQRREHVAIAPLSCDEDLSGPSRYFRYGIRDLRIR